MQQNLFLYDHENPLDDHLRIKHIKGLLKQDLTLLKCKEDLHQSIQSLKQPSLFLLHASEFYISNLETLPQQKNAFFLFYSGAGFKQAPSLPPQWQDQVLCLKSSIDLDQNSQAIFFWQFNLHICKSQKQNLKMV